MPQVTDSTEFQLEVLNKIKDVHELEADITDRMLLRSIFDNYRSGAGLRLSKFGYEICEENKLYEFTKIPLQRELKNSIIFTALDRICTSPYFVDGYYIYLSDGMVVTELTLCGDDFKMLFEMHM